MRGQQVVTVVDNKTSEETKGILMQYTKKSITIQELYFKAPILKKITVFDATKVHFKK